jgi:hypothetical protein
MAALYCSTDSAWLAASAARSLWPMRMAYASSNDCRNDLVRDRPEPWTCDPVASMADVASHHRSPS